MRAKDHYDNHLADFYSWMTGDFDIEKNLFKNFCTDHAIKPFKTFNAIDLGAGHGIQSMALGELGFDVTAIDFNEKLLSELKYRSSAFNLKTICEDIQNVKKVIPSPVDTICCCGDTISHMETFNQLDQLFQDSYELLYKKGRLILSFRDYSTALLDTKRFIPVKSDDNKILTCVLDFSKNKVTVTDLLYEKVNEKWVQKVSSYEKLRIDPGYVLSKTKSIGFKVIESDAIKGLNYLILEK
jgi:SAM-dependent methyltransferase